MDNNNNMNFIDEAKAVANDRTKRLIKIVIDSFFDYLEPYVEDYLGDALKDLPAKIKQLRNNPETEQEIVALWSKHLYEEGLVPKGYNGLPDKFLTSNLHQEGYLDGLYVGYALAMMALVDNDAPNDIILAVRDYIRPNLIKHHYDDRNEFISQYKDEKYSWIDKA